MDYIVTEGEEVMFRIVKRTNSTREVTVTVVFDSGNNLTNGTAFIYDVRPCGINHATLSTTQSIKPHLLSVRVVHAIKFTIVTALFTHIHACMPCNACDCCHGITLWSEKMLVAYIYSCRVLSTYLYSPL